MRHRPEAVRSGDVDRGTDAGLDVVGVDQVGRVGAKRGVLRLEGGPFGALAALRTRTAHLDIPIALALLTAGVIFGILVARVGAGVVAEQFGWRVVYWCAFALMAAVTLYLPFAMRSEGAVRTLLHRALAQLAELLEDEE